MKTNYLLLFLMFPFLHACEGEKIDFSIINRSIRVNARIDGVTTRVSDDAWTEGDAIGIYMVTAGNKLAEESVLAKNAKYVTVGDGIFNPAAVSYDVMFPIDGTNVDFIAYYPHGTINAAFEYTVDVTNQSDQSAIDLLYADNATDLNKNSTSVNLSFSHQLSKLVVHLKTIDGSALTNTAVTIKGVNTRGMFSLVDKSQTNSVKGDIAMKMRDNGASAEAIVLPADNLVGATLEIIDGEYGYVYDLNNSKIILFEPGYIYTYTIELNTCHLLSATATITDWLAAPGDMVTVSKNFKVYKPVGEGTLENPYTIEDARNVSPSSEVWVKGFIAGGYVGNSVNSFTNVLTNDSKVKNTSLALAESPGETNGAKTFPVSLPPGEIRDTLNLVTHPDNLGKEVKIKGKINTYYSTIGMPNATAYVFIEH